MAEYPYLKQIEVLVDNVHELLVSDDARTRMRAVRHVAEGIERIERCVVSEAHEAGLTWAEIGRAYDVTRQSAHKRFADLPVASPDVFAWLEQDDFEEPSATLIDAARRRGEIVKTGPGVHDRATR